MEIKCIQGETPYEINGRKYWTIKQFARLTRREPSSIRMLVSKGNKIRKLKADVFFDKPFVYAEELFEFPFSMPGKGFGSIPIFKFKMEEGELKMIEEEYFE